MDLRPSCPCNRDGCGPSACSICARVVQIADCWNQLAGLFVPQSSMRAFAAVTILLLALLSETVHAFGGGVPFALDADGCVVDYQPGCAALCAHSQEAILVGLPRM